MIYIRHEFKNERGYTTNHIESIWKELDQLSKTPGDFNHLCSLCCILILKKNFNLKRSSLFEKMLEILKVVPLEDEEEQPEEDNADISESSGSE